jgi:hypothetical protein
LAVYPNENNIDRIAATLKHKICLTAIQDDKYTTFPAGTLSLTFISELLKINWLIFK